MGLSWRKKPKRHKIVGYLAFQTIVMMRTTLTAILIIFCLKVSAQLSAGEIMFVGFNADGSDGFSILTLADIPANSTIYFTDNEWNGSPIGSGGAFNSTTEGEITWSTGAGIVDAGTVVNFLETNSAGNAGYGASIGIISGVINLNANNEVLYAFLGTDDSTPTAFLSAIANDGFNTTKGTLTNTGLTAGTNATSITGDEDIMVYTGSTSCDTSIADCAAAIATASNWSTQDGGGDQSADTASPDFPLDVAPSFGGSVLPVELVSFSAQELSEGVILKWSTATEINNDYFELHSSFDGVSFSKVATINGNGTTSDLTEYSYLDKLPSSDVSRLFYYLKQVDYDGQFEFLRTIVLELSRSVVEEFDIYPNPANGPYVHVRSNVDISKITISNMDGQQVLEKLNFPDDRINIEGLVTGNYFMRIVSGNSIYVRRLYVVK